MYSEGPHVRKHGPQGYADAVSYRPWLRDEFSFRCVYCLFREQWGRVRGVFNVDHLLPVALRPDKALNYDNLLYGCAACNGAKGQRILPSPEIALTAADVHVYEDGVIEGRTPAARRLIRVLGLDDPEYTDFRLLWLGIVALAKTHDRSLYGKLMGYPDDLPNLARLRPPQGNTRPEGLAEAFLACRMRGTLADVY